MASTGDLSLDFDGRQRLLRAVIEKVTVTGSRLEIHRGVGHSSRAAYRTRGPDPDGVTAFHTHELRPGWVPSIYPGDPGTAVLIPAEWPARPVACHFTAASPSHPAPTPVPHTSRGHRLSWGRRERVELYELHHACATLLMERGLPPHVVANQLGHTDGGALVQRLYGHPPERGMRDQIRSAFGTWGAAEEQRPPKLPGTEQVA